MLERRAQPSATLQVMTPVLAVVATMIAGGILFAFLGKDPILAIRIIFVDPLFNVYSRPSLLLIASPLTLIAIGLSFGFRAGIWNIGAAGQFTVGAITGGAVGLAFWNVQGLWLMPMMCVAGIAGGAAWAMIPAVLKVKYNANEILVSLMLVYVAEQLLSALLFGALRDPMSFGMPLSRQFHDSATLPLLYEGSVLHIGVAIALLVAIAAYILLQWHVLGFNVRLSGLAPRAAHFAGVSSNRMVLVTMGLSGGLAGLAGVFEATGASGYLSEGLPAHYGFTAIIVAFLGRLHPVGIVAASLVLALTYIGGEHAQEKLEVPAATTQVFQGLLLFFLLGADVLSRFRLRKRSPREA